MKAFSRLALFLIVFAAAGCANQAAFEGKNPYVSGNQGDLSPVEAARLSIATAQELVKVGLDSEAVVQYERAREADPTQTWISRELAVLYERIGRTSRARDEYLAALREFPRDAKLMNDYGYFNYSQGNFAEAEAWLTKAKDTDPFLDKAWINLGLTQAEQGHYKEALKSFEQVLPEANAHSNLGVVLTTQGKYAEARSALKEALRLDPDLVEAKETLHWLDEHEEGSGS